MSAAVAVLAAGAQGGRRSDGGLIAFAPPAGNANELDLWVARPDGTALRRLTTAQPTGADSSPAWSPDGKAVVFTHQARTNGPAAGLWVVAAGGRRPRPLTRCRPATCWSDSEAGFSRDGKRILFVRAERSPAFYRRFAVYVANADGTGARRLTGASQFEEDHAPDWSPDGRRIVFTRVGGGYSDPSTTLLSVDVATGKVTALRQPPRWAWRASVPRFSPDGRRLLVSFECRARVCGGRGRHRLGTMRADGTGFVPLPIPVDARDGSWSPSGTRLLFRCRAARLCTARADGREVRQVPGIDAPTTANPLLANALRAAWGPES